MMSSNQLALAPSSKIPDLVIARDAAGELLPAGEVVAIDRDGIVERIALPPIRALFRGAGKPGDLSLEPTPELEPLFLLLERTVVRVCDAEGADETDQQMERTFAALRRRSDGAGGRMHSYLRAAARLYMSVRDVSAAEYDAVLGRLTKSARTFSMAPISRNYVAMLRETFDA